MHKIHLLFNKLPISTISLFLHGENDLGSDRKAYSYFTLFWHPCTTRVGRYAAVKRVGGGLKVLARTQQASLCNSKRYIVMRESVSQ